MKTRVLWRWSDRSQDYEATLALKLDRWAVGGQRLSWDDEGEPEQHALLLFLGPLSLRLWRDARRVKQPWFSVDWRGFGKTKGAFAGSLYEMFGGPPRGALTGNAPGILAKAFGAMLGLPPSKREWEPWATYYPPLPPLPSIADLFPPITAPRGAIQFLPTPGPGQPWPELPR